MNMMSYTIFVYVGIFINLFIWEKNRLIFEVAWYNLILYVSWAFAFAFAAYLLSKTTIRTLLAVSAVAGAGAFVILTFLELDNRMLWIACIGVPVGIMYGFFSSAQNLSVSMSGTSAELGRYFSTAGSIQQVVTLAVPLLSAIIIAYAGYFGTSILMLVFLLGMLAFSFLMPKISLNVEGGEADRPSMLCWLWRQLRRKPGLRWHSAANLAAGVFLQFQQLFLLVFTFSVTENKFWIAGLNGLYTLATLGGLYVYRRYALKDFTLLFVGCVLVTCGFLIVLFPAKPVLIVSNLLTAVGMFCVIAAWNTLQFKWIKTFKEREQANLLVWRETLICVTRIGTLLIVLSVDDIRGGMFIALIVVALFSLLALPYFEYRARKIGQREKAHRDEASNMREQAGNV
ncbi:MFS transporter [Paenibacillus ginsengarvi]|uniref:MFS transporter n=2 Tax=Paenibacillus ginsengarvi TaxID=400777 RepID=A0A3B0C8T5_9BACL|nr:MFS transporter [Paenibacillus ginsengarvi]